MKTSLLYIIGLAVVGMLFTASPAQAQDNPYCDVDLYTTLIDNSSGDVQSLVSVIQYADDCIVGVGGVDGWQPGDSYYLYSATIYVDREEFNPLTGITTHATIDSEQWLPVPYNGVQNWTNIEGKFLQGIHKYRVSVSFAFCLTDEDYQNPCTEFDYISWSTPWIEGTEDARTRFDPPDDYKPPTDDSNPDNRLP